MNKISKKANLENLSLLLDFVKESSERAGFNGDTISEIVLASEEILVNIINYAYGDKKGPVDVICQPCEKKGICVTFIDSGAPFNSLAASSPDLSLPLKDRKVGGLGICLVKNLMNEVRYDRNDGKNVLTIVKSLEG